MNVFVSRFTSDDLTLLANFKDNINMREILWKDAWYGSLLLWC